MLLQYKTTSPFPAPSSATYLSSSPYSPPSSSSSSLPPSSLAVVVSQSPWWPAVSGLPTQLSVVLAIVSLVVVAVQRLRAAVHSRRLASRAVSSSKMSARPGPAASQPYGDPMPQRSPQLPPQQLPPAAPSQKRRDQPRTSSSSISYSRPLITVPLATVDRAWPPPPPMPTLALLQSPVSYEHTAGSRDEYYSTAPYQSSDLYDNQDHYGYPPFSAGPYPPPPDLWSPQQQQMSATGGAPQRFFSRPPPPPPSGYTYPPPFPLGPLPRAENTVLPPLHPDVTDSPLPGQKLPPPQQQPQPPPPSRTHRRSYSQKIIYPKTYSSGSHSTSKSAPELNPDMRDADPLTTPGGTTARGFDVPEGEAMGIEVSEEIIIAAEGWRRHTRVYGGGVCMACLESDTEMKERGINLDVGPILMEGFDPRVVGQQRRQQQQQQQQQSGESALQESNPVLESGEGESGRVGMEESDSEGRLRDQSKLKKENWWQQGTATGEGEAAQMTSKSQDARPPQ